MNDSYSLWMHALISGGGGGGYPGILLKDVLPNGHFADGQSVERTFCRTDTLTNGLCAEKTFCRKDRKLAENREISGSVTRVCNSQPLCKVTIVWSLPVNNGSLTVHNHINY